MNKKYNFEKFVDTGRSHIPWARINEDKVLYLSSSASRKFNLEDYSHVTLFWSEKEKCIGLEPKNESSEKTLKLITSGDGVAKAISLTSFVDKFQIDFNPKDRLPVEYNSEHNLVIVRLDNN